MDYNIYMEEALTLAEKARELEEVPIGCVIFREADGAVIGRGYNLRNTEKNVLRHAEIIAIEEASKVMGDWRLEGCTIVVTIEPCPMCAGAIVQARMDRVVFSARNRKAGCGGSILNLFDIPQFNHQVEVIEGVEEEACSSIMSSFFKRFRKSKEEN